MTILGIPVTKKNSQRLIPIVRHGKKRYIPIPSKAYTRWLNIAKPQARVQWLGAGKATVTKPCELHVTVYRKRATGDLDNYLAAVMDMLQAAEVLANDRLVVGFKARLDKDAVRPRIELEIIECA